MPRTFSLRWPHHSTHAARARRPIVRPRRSILALGTPAGPGQPRLECLDITVLGRPLCVRDLCKKSQARSHFILTHLAFVVAVDTRQMALIRCVLWIGLPTGSAEIEGQFASAS